MVRAAGIEPAVEDSQGAKDESLNDSDLERYTQIRAQISDADCRLLSQVVDSWARLSPSLKLAVLAIVEAAKE